MAVVSFYSTNIYQNVANCESGSVQAVPRNRSYTKMEDLSVK